MYQLDRIIVHNCPIGKLLIKRTDLDRIEESCSSRGRTTCFPYFAIIVQEVRFTVVIGPKDRARRIASAYRTNEAERSIVILRIVQDHSYLHFAFGIFVLQKLIYRHLAAIDKYLFDSSLKLVRIEASIFQ